MSAADGRRHWEIFRGNTAERGRQLAVDAGDARIRRWTTCAPSSSRTAPRRKVLLWLRGTYRAYTDYQQQVLMQILAGGGS